MESKKGKVAVAMSGGVDSSVAAVLLKSQGYEVIGLFAKTWTPEPGDGTVCTWVAERRDALRVAAKLGIPLYTVDLEADYRREVVEPFFAGYALGETPNPDILCNRFIKFGVLLAKARQLGADCFATGHYARILNYESGIKKYGNEVVAHDSRFMIHDSASILRGVDPNKDQSYFLWDIPVETLPWIKFPIGEFQKSEVRVLARKFDLPVANKKDSQGICFLGPTDLPTFLSTRLGKRPGAIRDGETGKIIGTHQGAHRFTIGQRQGLGVGGQSPRYVVSVDTKRNEITVGPKEWLYHRTLLIRQPNWLSLHLGGETPEVSGLLLAQVRYRQAPVPASLRQIEGRASNLRVDFVEPVFAPTPGQSIVFYAGDQLLGGAIIDRVVSSMQK